MSISVHFFRNRSLERIDYEQLINYFDELDECQINVSDDCVEIIYNDPIFDFPYRFLITKRSQVRSIYNLNADFFNINLLVEIPILLPCFVTKTILVFLMDLCRTFELEIYYEGIDNIQPFDITSLMMFLENERSYYISEHPEKEVYYVNRDRLMHVCNYQQMMPYLPSKIKDEANINPYIVMLDNDYKEIAFSVLWRAGSPMVFPPELDYVHVEEDGIVSIIPAPIFFKYCHKYMYELHDYMPGAPLLLLCGRNVNRAKKVVKKLRKESIPHTLFEEKRITNLVEK